MLKSILIFSIFYFITLPIFAATDFQPTKAQLRQLEQRIQTLQTEMYNTQTEYGQLQQQLQGSEENIGMVAQRLEVLHSALTDKKNALTDLQLQQKDKQKQLITQRDILSKQIRTAYTIGRQDYLKLWLNQEEPMMVGRMLTYYDYLNQARSQQIEHIKRTLQQVGQLEKDIQLSTTELNTLITQQTEKKQQLELSYGERQAILAQLKKTLSSQSKELKQLREDKKRLQKLLGYLDDALKDIPRPPTQPFMQLKGILPYPIDGKVVKRFGQRRIGSLKWQGLLISAATGQKVSAIAAGRIAFAQWFRNLGLLIIIDHGHGYMSLYGHNRNLQVKTGDWVEANQHIATVGESGGQGQIALYFEIRQQGKPVNPTKWLR